MWTRLEVNHNINLLAAKYYNCAVTDPTCGFAYLNASVTNPMAGRIPTNSTLNASKISQYLLLLPFPQFGTVTENGSSIGSSPYNALQLQVEANAAPRCVSGKLHLGQSDVAYGLFKQQ
jgi:hypothetical protein